MKNVVVIGGGTGLSAMMTGLKALKDVHLSAIISVADDGGSTGRLRDAYKTPAMGDVRHVLCAMAEDDNGIFSELMNFRFSGEGDVGGHQLGNLIFVALEQITGSFMGAVQEISHVLNVKGNILPCSLDNCILFARMMDGTIVRGEKNIPDRENSIDEVFYQVPVKAYQKALDAIVEADLIIYGIGSLYTSIMPNVIIEQITEAIYANPCQKVYFCNAMTQPGETDGFSVADHVRALEKHVGRMPVDIVVVNSTPVCKPAASRYQALGSYPVELDGSEEGYRILARPLIMLDDKKRIRHNPKAVAAAVSELLALAKEKD